MTGTWATGWATGDIVTAAEYKKSVGAIFDSTLGGTAATIDITSISAVYAHLMVILYARCDTAAATTTLLMRFNNDSAASYDNQYVRGSAAVANATETFGATSIACGDLPGATAGANLFSVVQIMIPHYAGSTNNKQYVGVSSQKVGTATGNMEALTNGGGWRSTAAINRITFLPGAGSFVTGTRATIYALGA